MMVDSLANQLWDKLPEIISFNENNTVVYDKYHRFISDHSKGSVNFNLNQKKVVEKFLADTQDLQKSEFSYASSIYKLCEHLLEIVNSEEIFYDSLFKEAEEIVKSKIVVFKKDSRDWKINRKKMTDNMLKENQKLEIHLKRYQNKFAAKQSAHSSYIRAECNKALSRNQVENHHANFLARSKEYEAERTEYMRVLEEFNRLQSQYYSTNLEDWGQQGRQIEDQRYQLLRSNFTNVSELCKSLATKLLDIADQLECSSENLDIDKDVLLLIDHEKTGDVPPRDVPFSDLESSAAAAAESVSIGSVGDPVGSGSGCQGGADDSGVVMSVDTHNSGGCGGANGNGCSDSQASSNSTSNTASSAARADGQRRRLSFSKTGDSGMSTSGSKVFSKLFGGIRKTKEAPTEEQVYSEVPKGESIPDFKSEPMDIYEDPTEIRDIAPSEPKSLKPPEKQPSPEAEAVSVSKREKVGKRGSLFRMSKRSTMQPPVTRAQTVDVAEKEDEEEKPTTGATEKADSGPKATKFGFTPRRSSRAAAGGHKEDWFRRRSQSLSNMLHSHLAPIRRDIIDGSRDLLHMRRPTKPKPDMETVRSRKSLRRVSTDQNSTMGSVYSKPSIEVVRCSVNMGPVEIVATPADAMASMAAALADLEAQQTTISSEYESISLSDRPAATEVAISSPTSASADSTDSAGNQYRYFYTGSCVAIHKYTSSDPSSIYLSFQAGDQFYVMQEDSEQSSGWLLVERIDRSQMGYVPESYMDRRQFEAVVPMTRQYPLTVAYS